MHLFLPLFIPPQGCCSQERHTMFQVENLSRAGNEEVKEATYIASWVQHQEFPTEQFISTFGDRKENIWISKPACRNRNGRKAGIQLVSPSILLGEDHFLLHDLHSKNSL